MLNYERSGFWLVLGARFVTVSCGLCIPVFLWYAKHSNARCMQTEDVVSASEVYELSSGCSTESGGAVMWTVHEVHALESPELSHLFVSAPSLGSFFQYLFLQYVLGISECSRGTQKAAPRSIPALLVGVLSLLAAPGPGFHAEESHSSTALPAASWLPALAVNWC